MIYAGLNNLPFSSYKGALKKISYDCHSPGFFEAFTSRNAVDHFFNEISKVFVKDKKVINIKLDPYLETADTDVSDNNFPRLVLKSNFDKFKKRN